MARIIGGIGASHTPTIAFARDQNKGSEPGWAPIFEGFGIVRDWVREREIDVLFMIFNDHITSFFFDHYSAFTLGVDDRYVTADEGGGARRYPAVRGHVELSRHIASSLVADEFDMAFFQKKPLDHGLFSPLSMITPDDGDWPGSIIPLQVGVLQAPTPNARRCYKLGKALRKAILTYPDDDLRVAVVSTGGLSHQVHGERCGFNNEAWDEEFLDRLESDPDSLAEMRLADYAERGGMEGAEVIMWLIMRGALGGPVRRIHRSCYLPSMTNIATVIYEPDGERDDIDASAWRNRMGRELAGIERLEGTYPFSLETSHRAWRLNDFLHRLVDPDHRARFREDPETLFDAFGLTAEERSLVRDRNWIGLIRHGVIFFMLEKLAAVTGVSNPEIYASMRGEDLETFQKSRNVSMQYSVAGSEKD